MGIRFPRMHVAESVVNRILNTAESLQRSQIGFSVPPRTPEPAVPDTVKQGVELDAALAQPTPALPGIGTAPDPGGTAAGENLLETVLQPES